MLQNVNSGNTVLDRRVNWQRDQFTATYFNENEQFSDGAFFVLNNDDRGIGEVVAGGAMKPDPGTENGWGDDLGRIVLNYAIPASVGRPPNAAAAATVSAGKRKAADLSNSKKRKVDKAQHPKGSEEKSEEKKIKVSAEEESKNTEQNSNSKSTTTTTTSSTNTNKNNAKGVSNSNSNEPKPDYIHVRARRGQATDSHSLAERVRREKISERMKYLQDLVPGCNKITGKAGMLDEIINYVQSLQRQVEFLSMKLAAINPTIDFTIDSYLTKETRSFAMTGTSSNLQFNTLIPEMGVNPIDVTLGRMSMPDTSFLDSSCLNQIQHLTWEDELQSLLCMEYEQGRTTPFTSQPCTGFQEAGHAKLEM